MNLKTNKKGFTLVELLAVIVVLALIMVLTVPTLLSTMNNTKKTTFKMYGERLLDASMGLYESQKTLGLDSTAAKHYTDNGTSKICYTIADLGIAKQGSFEGMVLVVPGTGNAQAQYTLYLTDGTLAYKYSNSLEVDISKIDDGATPTEITNAVALCK